MKLDIGCSKVDKTKNVSHYFQLILIISLLGFGLLHAHGGHNPPSKSPTPWVENEKEKSIITYLEFCHHSKLR